ncbi:MAG: fasciclin domain-containing protein [Planctomycetota bacterium]|nr:fasciclin domain-containing protein [Planctomycetota bacterium]
MLSAVLVSLSTSFVACAGANPTPDAPRMMSEATIVETAASVKDFSTLVAAVKAAGLVEALNSAGPFTVFAPTNDAFAKLPEGTVEFLLKPENKPMLVQVLSYHVVPGRITAEQVVSMKSAPTLEGQRLNIVVKDGTVKVDGATVTKTDINCSNGIVHQIDSVMLPVGDSITQVAAKNGKFKTLVAAVGAAGLAETLSGKGPFTVLAPTDEAFAKLPKGTVETLLLPENKDKLVAILSYHVVPGVAAYSDSVVGMKELPTVQGSTIPVTVDGSTVKVGDATVVAVDVEASNGVIHVIDTVLIPGE